MSQLEQVTIFTYELLKEARKRLNKRVMAPEVQLLQQLQGFTEQRLQCPFCLYDGNSAIIRNGCFKCFACGKFGRIPK